MAEPFTHNFAHNDSSNHSMSSDDTRLAAPSNHNREKPHLAVDDDEEDLDMDALIEELESVDGNVEDDEDEKDDLAAARPIPEELLQTDTRTGLSDSEVITRRKKYGPNRMKEEKENLLLKFLLFFVGPIQFVMEVSSSYASADFRRAIAKTISDG